MLLVNLNWLGIWFHKITFEEEVDVEEIRQLLDEDGSDKVDSLC